MTDEALRAAERALRENRSVVTEAAFLRERLRARLLDRERVELAAYAGHEAARALLGTDARSVERDFKRWYEGLELFGRDVTLRAAHAAAQSVLTFWEERPDRLIEHRGAAPPAEQLASMTKYFACPCELHARAARETFNDVVGNDMCSSYGDPAWALAHDAADDIVWAIDSEGHPPTETTLHFLHDSIEKSVAARASVVGEIGARRTIRLVIEQALISWALA